MRYEVFAIPGSRGPISSLERATPAAFATPVEEARAYVHAQAVPPREETSGRQGDKPAWVWGAVTMGGTVLVVRLSHGGHVARALLGKTLSGLLVTER